MSEFEFSDEPRVPGAPFNCRCAVIPKPLLTPEQNARRERWHNWLRWLPWSWRMVLIGPVQDTIEMTLDDDDAPMLSEEQYRALGKTLAEQIDEMVLNDSLFEEEWQASMPPCRGIFGDPDVPMRSEWRGPGFCTECNEPMTWLHECKVQR